MTSDHEGPGEGTGRHGDRGGMSVPGDPLAGDGGTSPGQDEATGARLDRQTVPRVPPEHNTELFQPEQMDLFK